MGASFAYKFVYLLHLSAIVVGFGSSFVYPVLAVKARGLSPREAFAINHATFSVSRYLTSYPIYAAGAFGVILVLLSEEAFTFSQTWISIVFFIFILAIVLAAFLHMPNLRAMDKLSEQLAAADGKTSPGGPPKQVAELEERGQKAAMYGGILHLMWLLLMIDMIWKPGLG